MKHQTIEVTDNAVHQVLEELENKKASLEIPGRDQKFLLVHLGVNAGLKEDEIALESTCYNSKSFCNGNEYTPNKLEAINNQNDHDGAVRTNLPLERIAEKIREKNFFIDTKVSTDPGRYLCNYI